MNIYKPQDIYFLVILQEGKLQAALSSLYPWSDLQESNYNW